MKFLLIAAFVAVATASPARLIVPGPAGPEPVIDDEGSPISVGPVIIDHNESPISVGPVIIDHNESPISVGPVIIDHNESPISVGPVIIDHNESPISVGPVIVDESDYAPISVGPAIIDQPSVGSPLVQIIVNVKSGAAAEVAEVESPAIIEPSPVIVVDNLEEILEQPIINAPVFPSPAVVLPDALN